MNVLAKTFVIYCFSFWGHMGKLLENLICIQWKRSWCRLDVRIILNLIWYCHINNQFRCLNVPAFSVRSYQAVTMPVQKTSNNKILYAFRVSSWERLQRWSVYIIIAISVTGFYRVRRLHRHCYRASELCRKKKLHVGQWRVRRR